MSLGNLATKTDLGGNIYRLTLDVGRKERDWALFNYSGTDIYVNFNYTSSDTSDTNFEVPLPNGCVIATQVNEDVQRMPALTNVEFYTTGDADKVKLVGGRYLEFVMWNAPRVATGAGVSTFNTRTGAVVAAASDYDASHIDNDSSDVSGTYVSDALDNLAPYSTTADPTVAEDDTEGTGTAGKKFHPGDVWVNTTSDNAFVNKDVSTGAAVWHQLVTEDADGDVAITRDFSVTRNASVTGTLGVTSDVAVNTNKFTVAASTGNTAVAGTLDVTGDVDVNSNFTVAASTGNTAVAGTLDVTGDVDVNSNVTIAAASGNTAIAGTLGVTGDFAVNVNKFAVTGLNGNTDIAGTLNCAGSFSVATNKFTVDYSNGNTAFDGNLAINTNKFTVTAASGNTLVAGTLDVTSDVDVNSNFTVTAASGNTAIAGTLDVTGDVAVNTNKFTVTAASGNTLVAGTLDVTGDVDVNSNFTVTAASGNTAVSGTLGVGGAITLENSMVIDNDEADRTMVGALVGIGNDNAPASNAPAGGCVIYFDGTDLMAVNDAGATAQLNSAAFA